MIERIYIRNFKSLDDLVIEFAKFNCFVGMNGAGKTTILQLIDFLAQQMYGNISGWLENRNWTASDLHCKTRVTSEQTLFGEEIIPDFRAAESATFFSVKFTLYNNCCLYWRGSFNRKSLRLTQEKFTASSPDEMTEKTLLFVRDGKLKTVSTSKAMPINFEYEGSILSRLKEELLPDELIEIKKYFSSLRSLELLSPHLLRKRSKDSDRDIGTGGERLSGYLNTIKGEEKQSLISLLKKFYPKIVDYRIVSKQGGWKSLAIKENNNDLILETEAKHLNDGLLRILAILAQENSSRASLILLDEIENGVNPQIIEALIDTLVESKAQIIVTTHSPMILNYLYPDVARQSVHFVYKNIQGQTRARRFFDLSTGEKLDYMGPGEAFVDTDLIRLTEEAVLLDEQDQLLARQRQEQSNSKTKERE